MARAGSLHISVPAPERGWEQKWKANNVLLGKTEGSCTRHFCSHSIGGNLGIWLQTSLGSGSSWAAMSPTKTLVLRKKRRIDLGPSSEPTTGEKADWGADGGLWVFWTGVWTAVQESLGCW